MKHAKNLLKQLDERKRAFKETINEPASDKLMINHDSKIITKTSKFESIQLKCKAATAA